GRGRHRLDGGHGKLRGAAHSAHQSAPARSYAYAREIARPRAIRSHPSVHHRECAAHQGAAAEFTRGIRGHAVEWSTPAIRAYVQRKAEGAGGELLPIRRATVGNYGDTPAPLARYDFVHCVLRGVGINRRVRPGLSRQTPAHGSGDRIPGRRTRASWIAGATS